MSAASVPEREATRSVSTGFAIGGASCHSSNPQLLAMNDWNPEYKWHNPPREMPSESPLINCCCYKFRQIQEITCKMLSDFLSNLLLSRFLYHTHCCGIWASWCLDATQSNPFQAKLLAKHYSYLQPTVLLWTNGKEASSKTPPTYQLLLSSFPR